jgi:8-oxo-dGTP pyrophosphatase MutT (NUDIX family)
MKWEVVSTEYLTKHPPYFVTRRDVCRKPDGTLIPAYYTVELPPSVLIFPILDDGRVLMVEQYRHPVSQISLELPGGFVDEGETPLEAARRELLEETGYIFSEYEYLGKVAANPGVLDNFTYCFLAKKVMEKRTPQLESSEEMELAFYTTTEVAELLRSNKIIQALHTNACFYALLHLGKLKFEI